MDRLIQFFVASQWLIIASSFASIGGIYGQPHLFTGWPRGAAAWQLQLQCHKEVAEVPCIVTDEQINTVGGFCWMVGGCP